MKRIIFIMLAIAMVVTVGIGSASAANSLEQGKMSVSVGMGDSVFGTTMNDVIDLSGRYLITKDLAIVAGFGLRSDGGDADASYLSFMGGVRKYFKNDDFAPFFGGQLKVVMEEDDNSDPNETTIFDLSAVVGAEYFLGKQFSLEGSIGLGFGQLTDDYVNGTSVKDTYFGTRTTGIRANFYF